MASLEYKIHGLGLVPGIWAAPFEVSNRSWVYEHHRDWLVKNNVGQPLQIGSVETDRLYVLDTTNPGAEDYLRQTYATLVDEWGIRCHRKTNHALSLTYFASSIRKTPQLQPASCQRAASNSTKLREQDANNRI